MIARLVLGLIFIGCACVLLGQQNASGFITHVKSTTCGPHGAPPPAAASSLSCETFWDGPFDLSRIDTTDAGGSFKWFTHNAWPNYPGGTGTIVSSSTGATWDMTHISPTPSGDYSIDGNKQLVLAPASNTPYGFMPIMLSTARYSASALGYTGKTFKPPFYVEFIAPSASTNGAGPLPGGEPNSIIWMAPVQFYTAGSGSSFNFAEIDLCEGPSGCGFVHNWQGTGADPAATDNYAFTSSTPWGGSASRYGYLFLAGGSEKFYIDDVLQATVSWSSGSGSTPAATPSNPTGVFTPTDIDDFVLQLGAGLNKNLTVQQIRVFQLPP